MPTKVEILVITSGRPIYEKICLEALGKQTYKDFKLTIFENKDKESLADITSRVFLASDAELVGKIDDDMLCPPELIERLVEAHNAHHFGYIGGFHFRDEEMAGVQPKITEYNGIKIWERPHIGGNFLIRRSDFNGYEGQGLMGLSEYQWKFKEKGLVNGYIYPFIFTDHMQDGRSKHCVREYPNKFGMGTDDYTNAFIRDSKPYLNG